MRNSITKIYAIYDSMAEAYMRPMFMVNDAVAVRNFVNALRSEQSGMRENVADYTLFGVGEWDDVTGTFNVYHTPNNLGNGLHLLSTHLESLEKISTLQEKLNSATQVMQDRVVKGDLDA